MADPELCGMTLPTYVEGFHDQEAVKKMRYRDLGATGMKVSMSRLTNQVCTDLLRKHESCRLDRSIMLHTGFNPFARRFSTWQRVSTNQ